ncbi:MAG: bifunctional DNA-formamidopyrimidine glycosylase/DNA-(apurinic or apyrimidinic site) lyase [Candidatus Paceibacterota bacterium]
MPELPEVQTTATILNKLLPDLKITDVWTDYGGAFHVGKRNIKDKKYFEEFKKQVVGTKIKSSSRLGKQVLINLSNEKTIVVHLKMTGHLLYGKYVYDEKNKTWKADEPGPLQDPYNRFIHFLISFSNGKSLALSDVRKFARTTLVETAHLDTDDDLKHLGPNPLMKQFHFKEFADKLLKKPKGKIKQVLMDQSIIAGIGNIYSDEILWFAGVHPESIVSKIPETELKKMFQGMKKILEEGIDFGGDSLSDYRNPYGEKGKYQYHHKAYQQTKKPCTKKGCKGIIEKLKIGGRSGHFCPVHQKLFK